MVMSYMNYPHCRASNKTTSETCYSCEKRLDLVPELQENEALDEHRTYAARNTGIQKIDRSCQWWQGLRAGAAGGLAWGLFLAGAATAVGGTLIMGMSTNDGSTFAGGMFLIFLLVLAKNVIYGAVLGLVLALSQTLCYQSDASRFGYGFGVLYGFLNGSFLFAFLLPGTLGALAGAFICYVERSWFRRQYAEFT